MMGTLNRAAALIGAIAVLMLSVAAVTITSRVTHAGSPGPSVAQPAGQDCAAGQADDATEAQDAPDTDQVDQQCGPQDAAEGADATGAGEAIGAADADSVEQQDGLQDAPDAAATP